MHRVVVAHHQVWQMLLAHEKGGTVMSSPGTGNQVHIKDAPHNMDTRDIIHLLHTHPIIQRNSLQTLPPSDSPLGSPSPFCHSPPAPRPRCRAVSPACASLPHCAPLLSSPGAPPLPLLHSCTRLFLCAPLFAPPAVYATAGMSVCFVCLYL